jgi:hypothetical protein
VTAVWSRSEAGQPTPARPSVESRYAWGTVLGFVVFGVSFGAGFLGEAVDGVPAVHPVVVMAGMSVGLVTGFLSVAGFPGD